MESYLPLILNVLIVPGLSWLKNKIQKDIPILWLVISLVTSVGVSWGAGQVIGVPEQQVDLNLALAPLVTLLTHSLKKTKDKVTEVKPIE
jgi:hypothetical protein